MGDFRINNGVLEKYTGAGGDVKIPQGVTSIGDSAFEDCSELTSIVIPDSVTSIEDGAFSGCCNIKEITLPESVKHVGWRVFTDCGKLTQITFLGNVEEFVAGFDGCSALFTISLVDGKYTKSCETLGKLLRFYGGKTLLLRILMKNGTTRSMIVSCAQYCGEIIAPLAQEDCPRYDKLLISGKIISNRVSEKGRLLGMLMRLDDANWPVAQDDRQLFQDFLAEKAVNAVAAAIEINHPEWIRTLCRIGAINDGNMSKVAKKLKASKDKELMDLADHLKEMIEARVETASTQEEPVSPEETDCIQWMRANKAEQLLISLGIDHLLPVKRKDGTKDAPAVFVKFLIAALINFPSYDYYSAFHDRDFLESSKKRIAGKMVEKQPSVEEYAWRDIQRIEGFLDRDSLFSTINDQFEKADKKRKALMSKALFRYADGNTVRSVCSQFNKTWYESEVLGALIFSDEREAMLLADKNKMLDKYAELRNTTADDIRDTVLSNVGLDEYGTKTYNLGNQTVIARMGSDLSFVIELPGGKTSKSMPKKGSDPELYEKANTDFSEIKKASKKIIKNRIANLFEEFQSGKGRDGTGWKTAYLNNPLLRHVASLLVWKQKGKLFTLLDKGAIDWKGDAVNLSDDKIIIAHPMEMAENEIKAWQNYFLQKKLKQPFAQVWEPVYDPKEIEPNRYEGCMIPYYRFMDQKKNGIEIFDADFHNEIDIQFKDCTANVERVDFERHSISPNHRFEVKDFKFKKYTRQVNHIVAYLDRVTVWERIRKDDVSVEKQLTSFTLAQIIEFIKVATEANANNVLALLLQYRNEKYPDYNNDDGLTLDW